jgi:hypothetical protein
MFGGTVTKLVTLKLKSVSSDVTPNATSFASVSYNDAMFPNSYSYSTQQITGINQTITLSLSPTLSNGTFSRCRLCYKVDSASPSYSASTSPASYGFTDFTSTTNVSISNGEYLTLSGRESGVLLFITNGTIDITNVSDGNSVVQSGIPFSLVKD